MRIRVGHSADPDDAFMFWALHAGRVDARGLEFDQVVSDIQTLNDWATEGLLEVTAISMGAYPYVADRYVLLPHGASMGTGYGPVVVARRELDLDALRDVEIVIPGRLTTAYLGLRLAVGTADRFVAMYVNELTCDYGDEGRQAVRELLRRAGTGIEAEFAA